MINENRLYEILGQRLRELREKAGQGSARLTQAGLADKVGLERTSITNIEKGTQKVPLHVLYKMCESLGAEINEVLPNYEEIQEKHAASLDMQIVEFGQGKVSLLPGMMEALREVLPQAKSI